jgi:hypothetical protein
VATQTYSAAGSGAWLCPAGVTSVAAACWGGGGGGQAGASGGGGGAGGGGGEYAYEPSVAVTPGTLYQWVVGNGGFSQGAATGGRSVFAGDTLTVTAHGGQGGNSGIPFGGTGSANSTHRNGGAGGQGALAGSSFGGGGGSSAGTSSAGHPGGNAGSGPGAGGSAPSGGGAGGDGSPLGGGGEAGSAPGGGGGGGAAAASAIGGYGAAGMVQLTYTAAFQPLVPVFPAGYQPWYWDFDNWIQAPLSFLTGKIVFRAQLTNALSLSAGDTLIPFNDVLEDPYSGWSGAPDYQWELPAGYAGTFDVAITVSAFPSTFAEPVVQARVGLNSAAQLFAVDKSWCPALRVPGIASGGCQVQMFGGTDSVQGYAYLQPVSGSVSTAAGQRCTIQIAWADQ